MEIEFILKKTRNKKLGIKFSCTKIPIIKDLYLK